jgi:histidine triad (HIT) family protein
MPTIFSKIVAGEIPCHKVWEDDRHLAFLDINPWCYGHTLVIPKREHAYLWDMPEDDFAALQRAAQTVAQLLKTKLQCARVCSMVVGYEVPHVHMHLFPTNAMTDFLPAGATSMKTKPDFAAILKKLAASSDVTRQFAEAFNKRDVAALKSLYAADATAQVMGSPFPEEHGAEDIAKKSLNHMLDEENPLTATAGQITGRPLVLFRDQTGKLDAAAWVAESDGKIKRMEYIVTWHRAEELNLIDLKMRVGK